MVNTKIRLTMFFAAEDGAALYSQQKIRSGAHRSYGSHHDFLTAKFRLKLKKVGKTTRSFRYDLNKVPYDCTVEVMNRFKGLELIECLKNYVQRFIVTDMTMNLTSSPRKRNARRQNSCLRKLYKYLRKEEKQKARKKDKDIPDCRVPEQQGEIKKKKKSSLLK